MSYVEGRFASPLAKRRALVALALLSLGAFVNGMFRGVEFHMPGWDGDAPAAPAPVVQPQAAAPPVTAPLEPVAEAPPETDEEAAPESEAEDTEAEAAPAPAAAAEPSPPVLTLPPAPAPAEAAPAPVQAPAQAPATPDEPPT